MSDPHSPHPDDLVTSEGVDEGSAASATEGSDAREGADDGGGRADGTLGPDTTPPDPGPAAPVPPDTQPTGPGQQLAEGEG